MEKINASPSVAAKETPFGGYMITYYLGAPDLGNAEGKLQDWPGKDKRVRQALNYAIDMRAIVKSVLLGHGEVLGISLEKEAFGFDPSLTWYPYDPGKARELLAVAGLPNGFEMTLHTPNGRYQKDKDIAQAVSQFLAKVGVKAEVKVWERSVYVAR